MKKVQYLKIMAAAILGISGMLASAAGNSDWGKADSHGLCEQ